uniref:ABC transporter domain-containing protein n=1 Tax=Strigamia maritima TaxID=126957 RepID=T1JB96_STRMM
MTVLPQHISAQPIIITFVIINILSSVVDKLPDHLYVAYKAILSLIEFHEFMQLEEFGENILTSQEDKNDYVISITSGRFSWSPAQPPILKDINLTIKQGQLVVITGPSGSGKSCLLATLLGETDKIRGRLSVQGRLAFVPSEPWVFNGSIKDNILFGHLPNDFLYESVIKSCQLQSLLKTTSLGDLTFVGSLGEELTKQQKLQLSVARAAYSSADVYLIENFASSLNQSLVENIFNDVIGPAGILKDKVKYYYSVSNKFADVVVIMHKGFIACSGSYDETSDLIDEDGGESRNCVENSSIKPTISKSTPAKIQKWKYSKKLRDCIKFYMRSGGAWNWSLWFVLIAIAIVLFIVSHFALQSWLDVTGFHIMKTEYNFAILLYILTSLFCCNVSFKAYVSCQHDKLDLLLRGITCEILPGEKIGVVGTLMETNAMIEALFCLIDPIAGNAFIDGVDINTIGLHQLRSEIGIISMDSSVLFPGSVRTNLDPFFEYSDEKVWKALQESQLSSLVHQLPLGLHDQIHEDDLMSNSKWYSALSLSRARLRNNRLVILDQASAPLERTVVENAWKCFHDCTLITLTTHLEDVLNCDRVIILDGGVIRCFQNPQEIVNQPASHL